MADRVSATICVGGALPRVLFHDFARTVAEEGLSAEWDDPPIGIDDLPLDGPLEMMAHEVAGGSFDQLESFCVEHGLPFVRSCDAYVGGWDGERVVFDGDGPRAYTITANNEVAITRTEIRSLGSIEAIEAYFASAELAVPPLTLVGEGVSHG